MKTIKLIFLVAITLSVSSFSASVGQMSRSVKLMSPQALVADLYKQHKKRSPFFQTHSRALLDKYFDRKLANLLWQDASSSGDEVGALDGDPLFNAQDMEIKNFSIHEGTGGPRMMEVPVTFENFGQAHKILFRLFSAAGTWKITNIEYDDGSSLVDILKSDSARNSQPIKIYLVALGDNGKTGKKIGCDDSLIAVTRNIQKTSSPLTAAIAELLLAPKHTEGSPNLENLWKGNRTVRSVSLVNGTATIRISGQRFVTGVCDEPRILSQIEATARQFRTVKNVRVFLGKQTLEDAIR